MSEPFRFIKAVSGVSGLQLDQQELALINRHTLREYGAVDLFAFKITACDNEIDRDMDAFPTKTLEQLAQLYVGKTVLDSKHIAAVENQCARVYAAQVIQEQGKATSYGEPYARLEVRAYIPRTDNFSELIQLIEAGIRKEVSVGCAVEKVLCSICGKPLWSSECDHQKGRVYEEGKCFALLEGAADAYEISFVAVPAQPAAGVVKASGHGEAPPFLAELQSLLYAVKELADSVRRMEKSFPPTQGHNGDPLPPLPPDDAISELIQSANDLYQQYANEKEQ